jgi:hypothetical protein
VLKLAFAVNQINETTSNEVYEHLQVRGNEDWLVGGVFNFDKWKAVVDAIANNTALNTLLEAAIASNGWAFATTSSTSRTTRPATAGR